MLPVSGNIQTVQQIIYTPSKGKKGIIKNIRIANTSNSAYDVQVVQLTPGGTIGKIIHDYSFSAWRLINDSTEYEIPDGSSLAAKASASTVTFVINGEEVSS